MQLWSEWKTPANPALKLEAESGSRQAVTIRKSFDTLTCVSFLLLVVGPGAPSSVLAPSSDARSP